MSGPVWMKFFVGDYLGDTMHLTCQQHGAYLLLIFAYWRNGSLPDDDALLAATTKTTLEEWLLLRPVVKKFFKVRGGFWRQKRIEAELRVADKTQKTRHAAAVKAAEKRWQTHASGNASRMRRAMQSHSPPLDSPPTDSESEVEPPPISPPPNGAHDGREQASRLPLDWQPDAADREFAGELGLDAGKIADQFRDYWQAIPGRKATRLDWHATFRNACRHYATRTCGNGSGRGTHRPAAPGFTSAIRRAFADADDENLG